MPGRTASRIKDSRKKPQRKPATRPNVRTISKAHRTEGARKQYRDAILMSVLTLLARTKFGDPNRWFEVSIGDKLVTTYFVDHIAVQGFANRVNSTAPFKADGIVVDPRFLRGATHVSHIIEVVEKIYLRNGWILS